MSGWVQTVAQWDVRDSPLWAVWTTVRELAGFLLQNLCRVGLLLIPPFQEESACVEFEDAGVERFVIMAMAQPVRMLVQDVRSAFQRGAESLRDFLDGRETEFFDEYLGRDSVFRPEIRFDFGKLAVSEMASHGVSHFMQFGKTNSS